MPTMTLIPYTIAWDAPADGGGSKIDKYQVRLAIHDGGYSEWIDLNSTDTRFVALLPNDVEITIEIRAVNEVGPGEANILQIRPVREPNPSDEKKQIGDKSVNIHLPDPPKTP
ncbi:fibronectin type III domain-containing protein [Candidatus Poribacteria bacterium]|nr:fibronectin type III domain-containing protein [Candidatus Poribacteria bacterium]MYK21430.1 fibronectin type III domain-containing protein [Candidatus Poribacteria bacterium]